MKHLLHRLVLLALAAFPVVAAGSSDRPNIVIIFADDLGYGDIQCYNPERGKIPTPQIDKLASQGMRVTDAHSSSGVCTLSRYTLLTGHYHWRSHLQSGATRRSAAEWNRPLINTDPFAGASPSIQSFRIPLARRRSFACPSAIPGTVLHQCSSVVILYLQPSVPISG